jgi:hypothetical protein
MDASTHTGNIDGIYHLRNPRNTAASRRMIAPQFSFRNLVYLTTSWP